MPPSYEEQRALNIAQNRALLQSLGIDDAAKKTFPSLNVDKKSKKSLQPRKRKRDTTGFIEPSRKSSRLEGIEAKTYSERELEAAEASLAGTSRISTVNGVRLKQLAPVAIPAVEEEVDYDPDYRAPPSTRDGDGEGNTIHFEPDKAHFTPNMTPEEMMRAGSFGGSYFRPMYSRVAKRQLEANYTEFPPAWYRGIDIEDKLTRAEYTNEVNRYGVKAGQTIEQWEEAGWIRPIDPRGWFEWYCRFYTGRRTSDDDRQIKRWLGVCGPTGRFKRTLVKKIAAAGGQWDDASISPILRQTLQHWAYVLTEADYLAYLE